ncbi:MAG: hypothetical protein QME55_06140, partial [Brevundimonas sp.]|nr:hypothetical protein [Brevundimonas sp.]
MKIFRWSSQVHKWLALIVGVQVLFWVGGGMLMTMMPIETVRSEHRVAAAPATALDPAGVIDAHRLDRHHGHQHA